MQTEIGKGAYYYGDNTLMQDWAVIWWNTFKKDKTGAKSQAGYRVAINNYIIPVFGRYKVKEVLPYHLQNFFNDLGEQKSKTTFLKTLDPLNI